MFSSVQWNLAVNQRFKEQIWILSHVKKRNTQLRGWCVSLLVPHPRLSSAFFHEAWGLWSQGHWKPARGPDSSGWGRGEEARCDQRSPWSQGEPVGHTQGEGSGFWTEFLKLVINKGQRKSRWKGDEGNIKGVILTRECIVRSESPSEAFHTAHLCVIQCAGFLVNPALEGLPLFMFLMGTGISRREAPGKDRVHKNFVGFGTCPQCSARLTTLSFFHLPSTLAVGSHGWASVPVTALSFCFFSLEVSFPSTPHTDMFIVRVSTVLSVMVLGSLALTSICLQSSRPHIGEGHGNRLQYFCLGHPMDRGAWRAIAHGAAKSWTRLSALQEDSLPTELSGKPWYNPMWSHLVLINYLSV